MNFKTTASAPVLALVLLLVPVANAAGPVAPTEMIKAGADSDNIGTLHRIDLKARVVVIDDVMFRVADGAPVVGPRGTTSWSRVRPGLRVGYAVLRTRETGYPMITRLWLLSGH